jgi:hypothetical protein
MKQVLETLIAHFQLEGWAIEYFDDHDVYSRPHAIAYHHGLGRLDLTAMAEKICKEFGWR